MVQRTLRVVCCGYQGWCSQQQDVQLMRAAFAADRLLFVEPQTPAERAAGGSSEGWWSTLAGNCLEQAGSHTWRLTPPPLLPTMTRVFPGPLGNRAAYQSIRASKSLMRLAVRRALNRLGWAPDILFVYHPYDLLQVGALGEKMSCWRIFDEVALLPGYRTLGGAIARIEEERSRRCTYLLASSRSQFEKRRRSDGSCRLFPNAVNFSHYHRAHTEKLPEPEDLRGVARPRVAFVGRISEKIDWRLVRHLVDSGDGHQFVFVGPVDDAVREAVRRMRRRPNFHLLGARPVELLPRYLRHLDVSLVPYVVNESTNTMFVIKVLEHLAAGVPVVSTDLAELRCLDGAAYLARTRGDFARCVDKALKSKDDRRELGFRLARENDWSARATVLRELIEVRLGDGT